MRSRNFYLETFQEIFLEVFDGLDIPLMSIVKGVRVKISIHPWDHLLRWPVCFPRLSNFSNVFMGGERFGILLYLRKPFSAYLRNQFAA